MAEERQMASAVITFERHPRQVLGSDWQPQLLTTLEEKQALIEAAGVDRLVVLRFDREMAALSARDFMEQVLLRQLGVRVLVTGYDNRFGHDRKEGFDDYVHYGQELGIVVHRNVKLSCQGYDFSVCSSNIRSLLYDNGDVETAAVFLERPYQLSGKVMPGEHIGHQLGFPTANLQPDDPFKLIPASGVYAVWAQVVDQTTHRSSNLPAMMNIGTRPTFDGRSRTLEVNIFDFDGDLYGQTVLITFIARLREERKFESPEALVSQLKEDRQTCLDLLYNKSVNRK
jgi:riboflavin kinase/FMN adenylyltransferase